MRVHKSPYADGNPGYYARVGDFFGPLARTSQEAIQALDAQLEAYHPLNHTYIRCQDGTVLHLFQVPSHGWNYNIIPPTGYVGDGVRVQGTFKEARMRAREHAEQDFGGVVE